MANLDLLDEDEPVNPTKETTRDLLGIGETEEAASKDLTPAQDKMLVEFWNSRPTNPPSLKELTVHIWGTELDGRTWQVNAIRRALGKKGFQFKALTPAKNSFVLEDVHKKFIEAHLTMNNALEMAQEMFNNPNLTNFHAEVRAVNSYIKSLNSRVVYSQDDIDDVPAGKYVPPKNFLEAWERINQYVSFCPDKANATAGDKKCVDMLISYLHTFRFIAQLNSYDTLTERRLAEDAFIRTTHDKPDLLQEEIDQYIEYSNAVVQGYNVQKRSTDLQKKLEAMTDTDLESMKVSMGLVEAIGKASTELNQIKKREQDLLDSLKVQRSTRLSKSIKDNASILNLVQEWRTEEGRKEWLEMGHIEQAGVAEEVEKMSKLDGMIGRIMGLTKDEIKRG